jgi:5-methylcytosine-specific restriction endonuclease McrA
METVEKYIQRECKHHGLTQYVYVPSEDKYRCVKCRSEAVQRRREKTKVMLVEYKGGCCQICGYNRCIGALEFHHIDPSTKEFGVAESGCTRSIEVSKQEADKCILVCSNCHREIHAGLIDLRDII